MKTVKNIRILRVLPFVFALSIGNAAHAGCRLLLLNSSPAKTLAQLEESLAASVRELASLRIQIDLMKGQSDAVSVTMVPRLETDFQAKRDLIVEYVVNSGFMTEAQWHQKFEKEIEKIQDEMALRKNKEENSATTEDEILRHSVSPALRARFYLIEAGKTPGDLGEWTAEVEEPFLLMNAPVSQYIWQKVHDLAAKHLPLHFQNYRDEPSQFKNRPLNPVESVSFIGIEAWIEDLNHLSRLGITELAELFENHQPGDQYDVPESNQLIWAAHTLIQNTPTLNFPPQTGTELKKYAWLSDRVNELSATEEIGAKLPLLTSRGEPFWDIFGNVYQITKTVGTDKLLKIFGGSFFYGPLLSTKDPGKESFKSGFRLIRRRAVDL